MNVLFHNKLALFSIFLISLSMVTSLQAKGYFCWNNDDGVRECGNFVPPQHSQKGFWKRGNSGTWEFINLTPSSDEITALEKQKEEERQHEEQAKKDEALLALFSSEKDIEEARAAILKSIAVQIKPTESILKGLEGNLEDLEESYKRSKDNPSTSESQLNAIQTNIDGIKKRIKDTEGTLQDKFHEQITTNLKYDAYLLRYLEIQWERDQGGLSTDQKKSLQENIREVEKRIQETKQYLGVQGEAVK